jgi:methylenetetrahydrofolate dehydrogenase (NADP+)/methenyltetrahydrofolate cyclohydrolase
MPATIINGRAIADEVLGGIAEEVRALGEPVHLAAVYAGDDPGLRAFVRIKQKAAQSVGIQFSSYVFDAADEAGARQTLEYLASDDSVHGIFIELPLPSSWDAGALISLIPADKDVDVLTPTMKKAFERGDGDALMPPSVQALRYVFDAHGIAAAGARVAVIGAGELVGAPVASWLRRQGSEPEIIDVDTTAPAERSRKADIVIAATGVPGLVTADWINNGAVVIDYGYGRKGDAYVGDVEAESVQKKAGLLTPVPGGMGPLVVAAVLENLVALATHPS